ncbi:MAG: hypothetical protein ACTSV2_18905 [Candidatus Thorarchaeota archaeon]
MVRITIKSELTGWTPKVSELEITKTEDGYLDSTGRLIPDNYIVELLEIINEAIIPELVDFSTLGISQDWLGKLLDQVVVKKNEEWPLTSSQIEVWTRSWNDPNLILSALKKHYAGSWTSDCPEILIRIEMDDGEHISIRSTAQQAFMIPWKITRNDVETQTYNVRLSKSISKLLPTDFANLERLSEKPLEYWLQFYFGFEIGDELSLTGLKDALGDGLLPITDLFTIVKCYDLNSSISSIDLDGAVAWNAELHHSSWPNNLNLGIHIEYSDISSIDLTPLLENYQRFVNLFLKSEWLVKFITNCVNCDVEIRFVNNQSLAPKAIESILEDMRDNGKESLALELQEVMNECTFFTLGEEGNNVYSRLIILPDKRVLLWHFKGDYVLHWKATDFSHWDYYGHRSVCVLISPSGDLE